MKTLSLMLSIISIIMITSCNNPSNTQSDERKDGKAIFLHQSTGWNIWLGSTNRIINKLKLNNGVVRCLNNYNKKNQTNYSIEEQFFPEGTSYGWNNYPFDYYNIWVKNAGEKTFRGESTLEILTKKYDVIVFKHCFPVSMILEDTGSPDINSEDKRIENYQLQYDALKTKMHEFPGTKFIVWTPAVCVRDKITETQAKRTAEFYKWMITEWDQKDDNIYIWDFYKLETEGGLYLSDKYAVGPDDSHPNHLLSSKVAPMFCQFVIDIMERIK